MRCNLGTMMWFATLPMRCNLGTMKRIATLLIAAALLAACGSGSEDGDLDRGRQIFAEHCTACHSLNLDLVIVGPSLNGVATRAAAGGLEPREVLRRSVLSPQADIVEGFADLMPPDFGQKLSEPDLEALLTYLLTLE